MSKSRASGRDFEFFCCAKNLDHGGIITEKMETCDADFFKLSGGSTFAFDVARIGRARGARCGIKAELLWSNGGGSRNPAKPGFAR